MHAKRDREARSALIQQWMETIVITALTLAAGFLVQPSDPLFARGGFPWVWFGPVLVALRYGVIAGIASMVLVVLAWFVGDTLGFVERAQFPKLFFLGGLLLAMVSGEYSGTWRIRLRRLEEVNGYVSTRLDELTKAYFALNLSHDRLEQNLISRPITLRDALSRLRGDTPQAHAAATLKESAQDFLNIITQFCQIEAAGLFALVEGEPEPKQLASIGQSGALDTNDPLYRYCLDGGVMTHVQAHLAERSDSKYLVVAPLTASDGARLGVVAIEKMAFLNLNSETLHILGALLGYYADGIRKASVTEALVRAHPDCPSDFALELERLASMSKAYGINTSLLTLTFAPRAQTQDILLHLQRAERGVDVRWLTQRNERVVLVKLMPLTNAKGVMGYLNRLEMLLQENFGLTPEQAGIGWHYEELSASTPRTLLDRVIGTSNAASHQTAADLADA
jgi:polysaccharide biosynthesis protein PelD